MADLDVLGSSLYGLGGAPSSGFDIVAPNAGGRPMPGQGQNGVPPNPLQPGGQLQGAPVSGLLAGILGLPQYGGAIPGATYTTPGQGQPGAGQSMSPQQAQQLLQMMQASRGQPAGSLTGAAQSQNNIGLAVGSGFRSLFDGIVNGGR